MSPQSPIVSIKKPTAIFRGLSLGCPMPRFSLLALLLLFTTSPAFAQVPKSLSDVASSHAPNSSPAKAKRGETVTYKLTVHPSTAMDVPVVPPSRTRTTSRPALYLPAPGDLIIRLARSIRSPGQVGKQKPPPTTLPATGTTAARDLGDEGGGFAQPPSRARRSVHARQGYESPACNGFGCTNSTLQAATCRLPLRGGSRRSRSESSAQYKAAVENAIRPAGAVEPASPAVPAAGQPTRLGPPPRRSSKRNRQAARTGAGRTQGDPRQPR